MIALVDHFLRSGASGGYALGAGGSACSNESVTAAAEVARASTEVERAFDATHSAIALRIAPAGGRT
jgi:hypothetical protein